MRVQVVASFLPSRKRQNKAHHFVAVKCSQHLAANAMGDNKNVVGHNFEFRTAPNTLLQAVAGTHLIIRLQFTNCDWYSSFAHGEDAGVFYHG